MHTFSNLSVIRTCYRKVRVVSGTVAFCCPVLVYVYLFLTFLVLRASVWWFCTPWISVFISRRLWDDVFPWLLVIMFLGVMGRTWKPCAAQIKTNKEMMGAPLSPHWPGGEVQGERRRTRERGGVLASSLICKKCITSEIKRKITEQQQNIQRRERERVSECWVHGQVGRPGFLWMERLAKRQWV